MTVIRWFLGGLLILLALSLGLMLLPAIIGIFVGIIKIQDGNILGGVIAIIIGIACQVLFFFMIYGAPAAGYGGEDEECPYCGSGDTDGNHCYTCDDDF